MLAGRLGDFPGVNLLAWKHGKSFNRAVRLSYHVRDPEKCLCHGTQNQKVPAAAVAQVGEHTDLADWEIYVSGERDYGRRMHFCRQRHMKAAVWFLIDFSLLNMIFTHSV